ncbi:MAG: DUF805 domain-containing protein [Thermoguttaceae bacterium]|nr:DUF805 domain-containing protein [Thermoguttaceae bacterium]
MAFCTHCGAQLENGAAFCVFCGAAQSAGGDVNPYAVGTNYSGANYSDYYDPNAPIIPGFGEAISICFRKYAVFKGRASREEYWYWFLFRFLTGLCLGCIPFVGTVAWFVLWLPTVSVFVRRMHDINRSGWWWFLLNLPLAALQILNVSYLVMGENLSEEIAQLEPTDENFLTILTVVCCAGAYILLAGVVTLIMLCLRGTRGDNKYGAEPVKR